MRQTRNVLIGFDADYQTKPAVCMQLATLIGARELDRLRHCLSYTTKVLSWEGYNGHRRSGRSRYANQSHLYSSVVCFLIRRLLQ
jgi:hypothetical protein